jgi:hypothetical protein
MLKRLVITIDGFSDYTLGYAQERFGKILVDTMVYKAAITDTSQEYEDDGNRLRIYFADA